MTEDLHQDLKLSPEADNFHFDETTNILYAKWINQKNCPAWVKKADEDTAKLFLEQYQPQSGSVEEYMKNFKEDIEDMEEDIEEDIEDIEDDMPAEFKCPITLLPMSNPVVAIDGHTYEANAIQRWFVSKSTSPLTGEFLRSRQLIKNHALAKMICDWEGVK